MIGPKILDGKIKNNFLLCKKEILSGGVVAFPTETVYGLGCNANNKQAVSKIFSLKNRPQDNPIILHIYKKEQLSGIALDISKLEHEIMDKFWPGPLTLVFKKNSRIIDEVSKGLGTIAVRMPKNEIALEFLKAVDIPIAAPSANISGKPSSTNALHVFNDFSNSNLKYILDGEDSVIGIESTVIKIINNTINILRPGFITKEMFNKYFPDIKVVISSNSKKVESPGMKYTHYKPDAKVIICSKKQLNNISDKEKLLDNYFITNSTKLNNCKYNFYFNNIKKLSKNLYKIYRKADVEKIDIIYIETIEENGFGFSLMNRIKKSAG